MMIALKIFLIFVLFILSQSIIPALYNPNNPTRACKSHCAKFKNDSDIFSNEDDMAAHLAQITLTAQNVTEIFDAFGSYSLQFKQAQLQNLLGFRILQSYEGRVQNQYGLSLESIISSHYSSGTCAECDDSGSLSNGLGKVKPYAGILDAETLGDSLQDELASKPLIDFPINRIAVYEQSRRLQTGGSKFPKPHHHFCIGQSFTRIAQQDCMTWLQYQFQRYTTIPIELRITRDSLQVNTKILDIIANGALKDEIAGFANMLLSAKYRDILLDTYTNCNNYIYQPAC